MSAMVCGMVAFLAFVVGVVAVPVVVGGFAYGVALVSSAYSSASAS